jgi:predicted porin
VKHGKLRPHRQQLLVFIGFCLVAYLSMKGNERLERAHAHQVSTTVHYALSQRTMLYVACVHQRASHGSAARINGVMGPDSGSSNMLQSIVRLGLSTRF